MLCVYVCKTIHVDCIVYVVYDMFGWRVKKQYSYSKKKEKKKPRVIAETLLYIKGCKKA